MTKALQKVAAAAGHRLRSALDNKESRFWLVSDSTQRDALDLNGRCLRIDPICCFPSGVGCDHKRIQHRILKQHPYEP